MNRINEPYYLNNQFVDEMASEITGNDVKLSSW